MDISVTKGDDAEAGYSGYHWANNPSISAIHYCATTVHDWQQKWNYWKEEKTNRRKEPPVPENATWLEFMTPAIEVFLKQDLLDLVKQGYAEYWHRAKDCKTHIYLEEDWEKIIGEFAIKPGYKPHVHSLIIGSHELSIQKKQLEHFFSVAIPDIQAKNTTTNILYFPKARFITGKKAHRVCTDSMSLINLKLLGYLYNTLNQTYP